MKKVAFNFEISIPVDEWDVNRLEEEFFHRRNRSFQEFFEKAMAEMDRRLSLRPQIRRCIICDLDRIKIPPDYLAIRGEGIVEEARKFKKKLEIPQPESDCSRHRDRIYFEALKRCIKPKKLELVDLEMIVMLCTGMTGFLVEEKAVRRAVYDYLLTVQTLGWARGGWQEYLTL